MIEWLKLNFASCGVRQTRSLEVLILYFIIYDMVFVNETYDMILNAQFHKKIVRSCSVIYPSERYIPLIEVRDYIKHDIDV